MYTITRYLGGVLKVLRLKVTTTFSERMTLRREGGRNSFVSTGDVQEIDT